MPIDSDFPNNHQVIGKHKHADGEHYHSQTQEEYYVDKNEQSKKELNEFVTNLRSHFSEEEQIVFPLALKADLS
jgi:iron-sulfur cluster repair protein YtfE (RIC family)